MVAQLAEFVSQVLPLTVGNGKPAYRMPFISNPNPSEALSNLAADTQTAYQINPYISEPSHTFDARG